MTSNILFGAYALGVPLVLYLVGRVAIGRLRVADRRGVGAPGAKRGRQ